MAVRDGIHRLLNDQEVTRLSNLFVGSRFTVEGNLQGAHTSPLKGFSIEFSDYRQYVPGDDLRHLDWRILGRSDRLYIRQYEEECNLRLYLMLDGSCSMAYGSDRITKYQFAAKLAASLAYITIHQQDSVGLTLFNTELDRRLPARGGLAHLRQVANTIADHQPASGTDLARNVHRLAETIQRRALVVMITDLFDDIDALSHALAHFRKRKHDVIVYHVLDPAEIDFPFRELGNFEDMETGQKIITNPRTIRRAYQEVMGEFLARVRGLCAGLDVDYNLVTTDTHVPPLVRRHLTRRAGRA